jgi:hypothetical protein
MLQNVDMVVMDKCCTKNASIIYRDLADGPALIDPYRRTMVPLDPVGADIWRLLDGTRSRKAVVDELLESYAVDEATLTRDVVLFFNELAKREMIR